MCELRRIVICKGPYNLRCINKDILLDKSHRVQLSSEQILFIAVISGWLHVFDTLYLFLFARYFMVGVFCFMKSQIVLAFSYVLV